MTARVPAVEPSLAQIFERMLERDKQQHDAWTQMASKVSDQSSAIQGLQSEMSRLVKIAEKQDGYNERQIALAEKTAKHSETFDRAFKQMDTHKDEFTRSIDELARELKTFSEMVVGYRGSIGALKWVMAIVFPIFFAVVGGAYSILVEKIADVRLDAAEADTRIDKKHDELRGQVDELRDTKGLK